MVKMILCTDLNGNIGKNNKLLFHMKRDMLFFRTQTLNNIIIMGYNTWLSLGEKPLLNRLNVVLTNEEINIKETVFKTNDLESVVDFCNKKEKDLYIIGGAYVYNYALANNLVDEVLITIVPTVVEDADTRVDMELMKDFNKKDMLETFEYKEMNVTIEKWQK